MLFTIILSRFKNHQQNCGHIRAFSFIFISSILKRQLINQKIQIRNFPFKKNKQKTIFKKKVNNV